MPRPLTLAVAQSGPIQKAEGRQAVVARLCNMLEDAADAGADIVVFTELALTTFFPRYYAEDDELVIATMDLDTTRFGKETVFDFGRHRWPEHYGRIASQAGVTRLDGAAD